MEIECPIFYYWKFYFAIIIILKLVDLASDVILLVKWNQNEFINPGKIVKD